MRRQRRSILPARGPCSDSNTISYHKLATLWAVVPRPIARMTSRARVARGAPQMSKKGWSTA
eukprot:7806153-Pyramimonas_sp.AAC.1